MRTPLIALLSVLISVTTAFAQQAVYPTREATKSTLLETQRAFYDFKHSNDLSQTKGWKWQQRWMQHWEQRLDGNGNVPNSDIFFQEVQRYAALKQSTPAARGSNGWSPVGPFERGPAESSTRNHGLGRINCVAFHPTDSNTMWVGVAQGGVWKTTNHGTSWTPLTDEMPILRVSDIAVDPLHPDTMYISVGDYAYLSFSLWSNNRKRHTHYGLGVFKTTDGGMTWNPTALTTNLTDYDQSLTRRVLLDPDSSHHLVAAGIYGIRKSFDGGDSWTDISTDVIWDIEADPTDGNILYATGGFVGNLGIGAANIMKSVDFGATWTTLNTGIPTQNVVQRIEVTVAPSDPNYVYAVMCNMSSEFYALMRSTDGGNTWETRSDSLTPNILQWYEDGPGGQGTYDLALTVDPNNRDKILVGGINIWGSEDGGQTFEPVSQWVNWNGPSVHADQHQFKWNPLNGNLYVCNDGGIYTTTDPIQISWDALNIVQQWPTVWNDLSDGMNISSFYRVGLSRNHANHVMAGAHDNSTYHTNGSSWINLIGGDGMEAIIHPNNPDTVWGSSQFGSLVRLTNNFQDANYLGLGGFEDGAWTTPFMLQHNNPDIFLAGYGNLWRSTNGGLNGLPTSNFPNMPGAGFPSPITDIAQNPFLPNNIVVTKRVYQLYNYPGQVWVTTDGVGWTDISAGLPDTLYYTSVEMDSNDPLTIWVTCGGFVEDEKVFKTTDGGSNWNNVSMNLPNLPVNTIAHQYQSLYNTVYIGMDRGVWYTNDTLNEWVLFSENLPNVIVSEVEIHEASNKLYIATFGRGIWRADVVPTEIDTMVPVAPIDTVPPVYIPEPLLQEAEMLLLPNPNRGDFRLHLTGVQADAVEVRIVNVTGSVLHRERVSLVSGSVDYAISVPLPSGVYFVEVWAGNSTKVKRMVVR